LGGDEFALIVTLGPGESAWQRAATHVGQATRPVTVENSFLRLEASAGIAESCRDELTVAELLRRADVAMYAAKAAGSAVEVYASKLDADKRDRAAAARDLASAIEQRQFVLHYQPKIDVSTGKVIGSEALVRWQHPTRGLLAPDDFLSTAEETGLMKALTRLVLRSAIEQTAAWRAEGLDLRVAVNLSASDLLNEQLANEILDLLDEYDVPVPALELEVTETVLMTHPQQARDMLERLHQLGLRIALDDYGVGYCTLAYLRDLPIDELKIDRSFVGGMADDRRTVAIVRSTIELAHALDLKVVAEGVEEQHALTTLSGFGCEFAQGYYFSRPLPAAQFRAFVAASASAPVPPHESAFSLS
jgi:EAL domain-containing protein (putative c-di-GMP-specific phosphodiesterase class I)